MGADTRIRGDRSSMGKITLKSRFLFHNLLLVLSLLLAGGLSAWRLAALQGRMRVSQNVYSELRTVRDVAIEVGLVRGLLSDPAANRDQVEAHARFAIGGLEQFIQVGKGYDQGGDTLMRRAYVPINQAADSARQRMEHVLAGISAHALTVDPNSLRSDADAAMCDLNGATTQCIAFVSDGQQAASGELSRNMIVITSLGAVAVAIAVALSAAQYRLVMAPLQRLRLGVRRVAAAHFTQKLSPAEAGGSLEFQNLADEFNRMAGELDDFYHRLEEQVRAKSRELARSERLASVGFLAAGVAHEVNSPLSVICGYAELAERWLEKDRVTSEGASERVRDSLRIIREESFRCKQITEKLLELARDGSSGRETLDLAGVARDVVTMTRGLKNYRDRQVTVKLDPAQSLEVRANMTEMKQVVLNLTVNALESVASTGGEVCIEGRRAAIGWNSLCRTTAEGLSPRYCDRSSNHFSPRAEAAAATMPKGRRPNAGPVLACQSPTPLSKVMAEGFEPRATGAVSEHDSP